MGGRRPPSRSPWSVTDFMICRYLARTVIDWAKHQFVQLMVKHRECGFIVHTWLIMIGEDGWLINLTFKYFAVCRSKPYQSLYQSRAKPILGQSWTHGKFLWSIQKFKGPWTTPLSGPKKPCARVIRMNTKYVRAVDAQSLVMQPVLGGVVQVAPNVPRLQEMWISNNKTKYKEKKTTK